MVAANGTITADEPGVYLITSSITFSANKAITAHMSLHTDGTEEEEGSTQRVIANPNDEGSMSFSCLLDLSGTEVLTLMIESDVADTDIAISHLQFNVVRIY